LKIKFKDILSNPYRDLKSNPLIPAKIVELGVSINATGFWDNVVVRKSKVAGKYEIACGGHHRIAAAKEAGLTEADFIVKEFTDAQMIQVMDAENREIYASSPASVIESVKAVVAALADGTIQAFEVDPKTNAQHIRYAPSYVAGKEPSSRSNASIPYTSTLVAKFLGRVYPNGRADTSVEAALNFLHLQELGAINKSVLVKEGQPITARKLFDITADLKKRTEIVQERRGKTAAEIEALRQQQLEAQAKAKADEKKAEEERKALLKKLADAERAENEKKADALVAEMKRKQAESRNTEERNKIAMKALDDKIAKKKEWEAAQRVQDEYLPIRRDVEAMLGKLETIISERNPFREDVKSLSKRKGIKPEDLVRLRKAAMSVANWYADWVAPQFAPELKAAQKVAAEKRKATQIRTDRSGA